MSAKRVLSGISCRARWTHAPAESVHLKKKKKKENNPHGVEHAIQVQFVWPWNVTFALLRPRPALELCGGGFITTDSLLGVSEVTVC